MESSAFSPVDLTLGDFLVKSEEEYKKYYASQENFFRTLLASPWVDVRFGCCLRGFTGGKVRQEAWEEMLAQVDPYLEAHKGAIHGVYLDLHGAMGVHGEPDPEGALVERIRRALGESVLISASFDLHGNISPNLCKNLDMLCAYKTSPHVDIEETKIKAFSMLLDCLTKNIKPTTHHIRVPILIAGEKAMTTVEPGKSLYESLSQKEQHPNVLNASIFLGCPWTDESRVSCCVTMTTISSEPPPELEEIARSLWDKRSEFSYPKDIKISTIDGIFEMISNDLQGLNTENKKAFHTLCDLGDNVSAGATGDITFLLEELIHWCKLKEMPISPGQEPRHYKVLTTIWDRELVEHCVGVGEGRNIKNQYIGRKSIRANRKESYCVELGTIKKFWENLPFGGKHVLLECFKCPLQNNTLLSVDVLLTQMRKAFLNERDFLDVNLLEYSLVILKGGYLFPKLQELSKGVVIYVETPGAVDPRLELLKWNNLQRPIFPLDTIESFLSST
uniref:Microcystin LR degradation protein MlrC N-terminal domain-containing protein n=1 Tax=Arcella intermedia TaxID=1963864 RepID=A0A6B2L1Z7_9EUKA